MMEVKGKTKKVHLGVLKKNESKEEDMLDICKYLHKYVPNHSDDATSSQKPIKILSGGDYLTFERHKGAQSTMQDARTPSKRLEGLIPKMEDFHQQAEWLDAVCWKQLYDTTVGQHGTSARYMQQEMH
ncbi:uncharacterized protein LOC117114067 [Anneissia japonica]|uniref:uncharacterized protein LOC117114067 n=1 Tax=Anneissia japonica TaxID=1529436 RepID=UPI001425B0AC|nr:uncharacterized protein LOC117114067 [Anneissia japonica]